MTSTLRQVGICWFVLILSGITWAGAPPNDSASGEPVVATALSLVDEPENSRLSVEVRSEEPPRFDLVLVLQMSTPGWRFKIDKIDYKEDGRLVIKVTKTGPKGIVSQVLTRERLRIPLGAVPVGRYQLELHLRRDSHPYGLVGRHTLVAGANP
jgi:hypothetical protein